MTANRTPVWPLPVLALVQVAFGLAFVPGVAELDEPSGGLVLLWSLSMVGGCLLLAVAARNCWRLWRIAPDEGSWSLIVAVVLVGAFSGLWATGPLSIGAWHWDSFVLGALAGYLVVVLVRELRRRSTGHLAANRA